MKKTTKIVLGTLFFAVVLVWVSVVKSPTADTYSSAVAYFLNVGQGDAILIQKGPYQLLIDGGPDDKVLSELGKAMPLSDRKIETVVLTHPHADHVVGLNQVMKKYDIGEVYYNGIDYDSSQYKEFIDNIKKKNISAKIPVPEELKSLFDNATLQFLWLSKDYDPKGQDNANNTSIVSKFCYFSRCILLTGDAEQPEQESMIKYYSDLGKNGIFSSEVIKMAHHGSSNGLDQNLMKLANLKTAIISVGADNKYGHPHAAILDYLTQNNITMYRTDRDGTVKIDLN